MRASTITFTLLTVAAALLTSAVPVPEDAEARSIELGEEEHALEARSSVSGQGTWFYPGMGACGWRNNKNDYIAAVSSRRWKGGYYCGKKARVCHGSKCTTVKLVDECPGCSSGSLDLSPAAFKALAPMSAGVVSIKWSLN